MKKWRLSVGVAIFCLKLETANCNFKRITLLFAFRSCMSLINHIVFFSYPYDFP